MQALVLVVDDNRDDRQILATFLRHFGYDVVEAADGLEALKRARERRPAVALIDLAMPGVSGTDLAALIRTDPELAGIRLVAVSAHREYHVLADRSGFDVFLEKPCDADTLATTLRRLIGDAGPFTLETPG